MKRIVIVVVVLAIALSIALALRIQREREASLGPPRGSATVEATTVDQASRIGGRIVRVLTSEGTRVEVGAALVELDCAEPRARLAEVEGRLHAAEAQVDATRSQVRVASRARTAAAAAARASQSQLGIAEIQSTAARREVDRASALGEYVTRQRQDTLADGLRVSEQSAVAASSSVAATRANAQVAAAQVAAVESQIAVGTENVRALEAAVALARLSVSECTITATRAGTVATVFYEAGELLPPGAPAVRLVDLEHLTATFYLPNAELAALATHRRAEVLADALPDHPVVARVRSVGTTAEFTPRTIQTRSDRDRLVFPVEVEFSDPGLLPGMPVEVRLLEGS